MRIVTLNVWTRSGDWRARGEAIRDGLRALRPDVVALQETVVLADYDQAREIFGPTYEIAHQGCRQPNDGMGYLDRQPLADT